ncbi:MAG: putative photosynthetic complex assembly protein PuhE, partial [Hyphomicrobiaceae bacterium]
TFRWSFVIASIASGLALLAIGWSATDESSRGAYVAFLSALMLWGWNEMSFLMGFVTGPRRGPCPVEARGWQRVRFAIETILFHELAIAGTAGLLVLLTHGAPNKFALWTFLLLWAMRISAKLNVFLGVRNLSEDWLPDHLKYLESYLRRAPMNLFFPVSVTLSTILTVLLAQAAFAQPAAASTGWMLLTVLMGLAVLEHWILVLPFPFAAMWSWGLRSRRPASSATGRGEHVALPAE